LTTAVLDRALYMKNRLGTEAAALWLKKQGVSFELSVIALVGSSRARYYGVHVSRLCQKGWNK
jgi:hypothetical protein